MGSIPAFAQVGIKLLGDSLDTANDLSLTATQIKAAGDASLTAGEALTLKAVDLQADRNFELSSVGNAAIVSDATTAANGSITQATSRIKAGNQANVTALGDLAVQGGDVQAKDINLTALGDVTLTGVQNKAVSGGGNDTTTVTTTQSLNLKGDNINIQGVGQRSDVTLVAANVDAANKAKIAGSGNVTIASGENRSTHETTTQNEDCNWLRICTTTVTHSVQDQTTQVGSNIKGGAVDINAGKNLTTVASTIESSGNVNLTAQGAIDYQAALNVNKNDVQSNSSTSLMGIDTSWLSVLGGSKQTNDSNIQTHAATTQLQSEADILSESGGNTRLQGTQVRAQNFTANTGVGSSADPSAKIIIEGVKETLQSSRTEKSKSLVWQAQSGQGQTEQTLAQTNIQATTKFSAPGGIDVQLPAGDPLKEQIQSLSQQPGMAWLNDLSQRKDVNWQEIKLAKDKWDYSQEGLTQTGAIMIAIAVTIATQGSGTDLVGTTTKGAVAGSSTTTAGGTTLATTTGGVTTYTAEGAALNVGYTALMSQAAVTLANNKGDIGKTMQDMGKSDNIKSIVTSAVTAGALQSVNPDWMKQLSNTGQFTDKAVINLTNAAVSATIKTAIQGGSYEDNLTASLKTAGIDTVAGWAASNIGQGYKNGDGALSDLQGQYIAHKVAHALVGCVSAAAKDSSCAAGALGGAMGEAFAEMYGQSKYGTADGSTLTAAQQQEVLNMSKLVTAAVAGMTGKDAQAAVDAAAIAVINNFNSKTFPKRAREIEIVKDYPNGNPLKVTSGQFTFDLEGGDKAGSVNDSRVLHHPTPDSGVTIGRGVDLKYFTAEMVDSLFGSAGFSQSDIGLFKQAAGKTSNAADDFVKSNKEVIGRISVDQQNALFQIAYPLKQEYASEVYSRALVGLTGDKTSQANWAGMNEKIKTIYTDLLYQGALPAAAARTYLLPAMLENDVGAFREGLIKYNQTLTKNDVISRNIQRIGYLK